MKKTHPFGAATAQGTWPVQEDGYFADPMNGLFALSDGFGGRGAGDLAAKAALLEVGSRKGKAVEGKILTPALRWQRDVFERAQASIQARNQGRPGHGRGGCSLLIASVAHGRAEITQCGACSAHLIRAGKMRPLILPQAAPREDFQPQIPEQALGLEGPAPECRGIPLEPGDILLLASSGVEWESESFQSEVLSNLGMRLPGSDLGATASHLVENSGLSSQGWNRTILLIESI